ncbi:MAG: Acylphosphatase [Candidatus Argoarchaeum ethanivorans]|uniref:acylphosphatase n=1 Tax=Candidatus Argoarchaeum ethanivorans TaxID=2608793 RepID=A0A811T7A4_9EURY|nr:MAG: Acylphosphatase [Candidatus Argoarchaeum ethanivorans]
MKRAVIVAKGNVQRVGYRDMVEKIASKLELTGFVENLKPRSVRIVAEGEEKILSMFVTQVKIEEHPIVPVSVEEIDVKFGAATREFEYFEIKRGDPQEELGERMDTAGALLYRSVELGNKSVSIGNKMLEKQDAMLEKQDAMLEKQDTHTSILVEKMDAHTQILTDLRDQTQQNFEILDVKYGRISENMERVIDEMRDERRESRESINGLTDAILKLAERR